ncbi:MAG: signal transduction histidine kinase [Rhodothermales bacterium]|jgi:signal transduction histidine kinase
MENPTWLQAARSGRWSISSRLAIGYGTTMLLLLSVFAGISYTYLHTGRHRDFDQHLNHEHRILMPLVAFDETGNPVFEHLEGLRSVAYQTDGVYGTYVRLIDSRGIVRYQSPNFEHHAELALQLPDHPGASQASREWEGEPVRTHYLPLVYQNRLAGWLEVTGYEWSLHQDLYRLRQTFSFAILVSLVLAIGGGYLLARRALAPVSRITSAANEIEASDLSARVPAEFGVKDELSALADTINRLLERLEASFLRERRFSSSAAHELVTPLAVMRGELELAVQVRTPEAMESGISAALEEVDRMKGIVRALGELSKAERLRDLPVSRIDLAQLCRQHVEHFHDRAEVHGVELRLSTEPDVFVMGDAVAFGKVIDNLLDNALKYTPSGNGVGVSVHGSPERATLEVSDSGYGFESDEADRLFDRFFRSDNRLIQHQPGSGIGLSIVQAVVQALGGTVSAASEGPGRGSRFTVNLPRVA